MLLNGVGILGVGVFPGDSGRDPSVVCLSSFIAGGLCGIAGGRARSGPVSWFSYVLGAITIGTLLYVLFGGMDAPMRWPASAIGGAERWIAYPVVLWQVMFGGALMAGSMSRPVASP